MSSTLDAAGNEVYAPPTYYAVPTAVLLTRPLRLPYAFVLGADEPPPREPAFLEAAGLLRDALPADGRENDWQVLPDGPGLADSGLPTVTGPFSATMGAAFNPPPAVAGPETRDQHNARVAEEAREAAQLAEAWCLYDDALRDVPALLREGTGFQEPAGGLAHACLAVWHLHTPVLDHGAYPVCEGCDPGQYADGRPEWPCSTAEALAGALGVSLPDHHDLAPRRPVEGTDQ